MFEYKNIFIIIVTYNGANVIEKCIDSIFSQNFDREKYQLLIIDNNSTDETRELIKKKYPDLNLIVNKKNYGFGKANNIGINSTNSKYVVLLNQDSYVEKDWLKELVNSMKENPDVACCGAKEISYDFKKSEIQRISADPKNQIWMGCGSIIFRRDALIQAGLFDEFYFMYGEDIDLSFILKILGWRIILNEKAKWYHKGHDRKILSYSDLRLFHSWRGRIYLILKLGSFKQIIKFLLINKKKSEENAQMENKKEVTSEKEKIFIKIKFISKLILSLFRWSFYIINSRRKIKKIIKDQSQVDSWIEYINKQFYHK